MRRRSPIAATLANRLARLARRKVHAPGARPGTALCGASDPITTAHSTALLLSCPKCIKLLHTR